MNKPELWRNSLVFPFGNDLIGRFYQFDPHTRRIGNECQVYAAEFAGFDAELNRGLSQAFGGREQIVRVPAKMVYVAGRARLVSA